MKSVRYKTANILADLIVFIGVFVVAASVLVILINIEKAAINLLMLTFPVIAGGIGLVVIAFGQSIKAMLDTANNSFETVECSKQILLAINSKKD